MVIILAGPDCSGKSTFFGKLDKNKYNLIKGGPTEDLDDQMRELSDHILEDRVTIYDRCPVLDDIVYYPIFNEGKMSRLLRSPLLVKSLLRQCVIVYFSCHVPELIDRLKARGDEYIAEKNIPVVISNYRTAFGAFDIEPEIVRTDKPTPDEVFDEIMKIIEKEEKHDSSYSTN